MENEEKLESISASPLYRQLLARLRSAIKSGEYPPRSRIPSEKELCANFGISRVTVRKALNELTEEGLIERHQGKGSFVKMPRFEKDLHCITSFTDNCKMLGLTAEAKILRAELRVATEREANFFYGASTGKVVELRRLRLADGLPVMIEINVFSEAYTWLLEPAITGSLYAALQHRGIRAGEACHEISLCKAGAAQAEILDVEAGTALLLLEERIYDESGAPMHLSTQRIRADSFTFRI